MGETREKHHSNFGGGKGGRGGGQGGNSSLVSLFVIELIKKNDQCVYIQVFTTRGNRGGKVGRGKWGEKFLAVLAHARVVSGLQKRL